MEPDPAQEPPDDSASRARKVDRRHFLALAGGGVTLAALMATRGHGDGTRSPRASAATVDTLTPTPSPTPAPEPLFPAGVESFSLMRNTEWETPGIAIHTGLPGSRVMVFGGVHGNEPGGWLAAEEIATWRPLKGSLIVLPKLNRLSAQALVRTGDGFGDLNRAYPGNPNSPQPMLRMAAEVVQVAKYYRPKWLFDLHDGQRERPHHSARTIHAPHHNERPAGRRPPCRLSSELDGNPGAHRAPRIGHASAGRRLVVPRFRALGGGLHPDPD